MVPTKTLWGLVAAGIPLAALGGAVGLPWVGTAYNLILLLLAYLTYRFAPNAKDLRVVRQFDTVLSVRTQNRIILMVSNESALPIRAILRDEPPPDFQVTEQEFDLRLQPGADAKFSYFLTPSDRGGDFFRGTFVRIACPLGLVWKQQKLATEQPVRVYPNLLALKEFDLLKQQGRLREIGIRRSRMRGLGTEFESLREYTLGDDYRKVDWKASARLPDMAKLMVRQYEQERNQSVLICIDIGRHMLSEVNGVTKLDHTLDSCLMLMHAAAIAGDNVGLLVYADTVKKYLPPRKGRNQVGRIVDALHDLVAEPLESDANLAYSYLAARWKKRSLLVAFTGVDDAARAQDLSVGLGSLSRQHLTLLVRISDPRLKEALETPLLEPTDLYRKAAGQLVQEEWKTGGAVLNAVGIRTLESEPQDLASALVSYYFDVKAKALI